MKLFTTLAPAVALVALPSLGFAQDATEAAPDINPYIFTTLLFLIGGFLVFWMAAGFAMLEAGLVRSKNVTMQLTKNIALFSIAAIMYWFVGFNLMYPGDGWTVAGYVGILFSPTVLEPVGLDASAAALDYASVGSDFFFQLMFCATTASIVSGTLAERIKLWPFLIFVVVLTGFIYPDRSLLAVGWRLALRGGLLRLRRFDPRACRRRFRSPRRCAHSRSADRQVQGWPHRADAGFQPRPRHSGHVHPVARLVRLQRRFAARSRHRG